MSSSAVAVCLLPIASTRAVFPSYKTKMIGSQIVTWTYAQDRTVCWAT